jgi:hypothetical protein
MASSVATSTAAREPQRGIISRMLNICASPGEVFDEVLATRTTPANWLMPALLVACTSLFAMAMAAEVSPSVQLIPRSKAASLLLGTMMALAGTFWTAFLLWILGRVCLNRRILYPKALEIVGLCATITVLAEIVSGLLAIASGDPKCRPTLALLAGNLARDSRLFLFLDACNPFHVWTALVLALGFSRLAAVSFYESAFWVLGYWFFAKLALVLLV